MRRFSLNHIPSLARGDRERRARVSGPQKRIRMTLISMFYNRDSLSASLARPSRRRRPRI